MRPRKGRDELERERTEAANDTIRAADKNVLLTNNQTIGTWCL